MWLRKHEAETEAAGQGTKQNRLPWYAPAQRAESHYQAAHWMCVVLNENH